jgi:predicted anti-sigma-YlaC factor YlaD
MRLLTCQEVLDYLTEYLEGNLPAGEHARLDEHLAVCPMCVDYLNNFKAAIALTKHACEDDPALAQIPEELVQAILAARGK